jgi:predicted DNA-binding WGR domain protein
VITTALVCIDPIVNAKKHWSVRQDGLTVTFRWGRIGRNAQSLVKTFETESDARRFTNKKIDEKLGKGYDVIL